MRPCKEVYLGKRKIGEGAPSYIIAEIGVNFNGDLDLAKRSILAAYEAGADAAKFQTFKAEEFVADPNLSYSYTLADGSEVTETQYEMFKRLELPDEWHRELKEYADKIGIDFLSSTADRRAVDLLIEVGAPAIKLASEDLINVALLEYVATKTDTPVILSTGMAEEIEIELALGIFESMEHQSLLLLHCVSAYPTPLADTNLNRMVALKERFQIPVGFSDHTEGSDAAMVAAGLGACVIEKHFTLDRTLPGPDHRMSIDPEGLAELVRRVRLAETMLGDPALTFGKAEESPRIEFRRSIVAGTPIQEGTKLTLEMLAYRRPGHGLKPYERELVVGKRLKRSLKENELVCLEDLE